MAARVAAMDRINVGAVLGRVFDIYGRQFTVLVPAAFILFLPIAVLSGAIESGGDASGIGVFLAIALGIVGTFWFQGVVVEAVRDIRDGRRDVSLGGLFRAAAPAIGQLIIVGVLAGVGIGIGLVLLIVPGLILLTIWAVVVPVVVIERPGVGASFGRSRDLVRGNGWPVFGVLFVIFLLQAVLGGILGALFGNDTFLGSFLGTIIGQSLVAPFGAVAASVLYFELRDLKEGPGGELAAAGPPLA
jgi:hypothetical protein